VFDTILDADGDGVLSVNEIRTLTVTLHGSVMELKDFYRFREDLFINCSLSVLSKSSLTTSSTSSTYSRFGNPPSVRPILPYGVHPVTTPASTPSPSNITDTSNNTNIGTSVNDTATPINNTTVTPKKSYTTDEEFPVINKEYLQNCDAAKKKIEMYYSKMKKNKFEIVDTDEVAFVMIGTNSTDVLRAIDGIRSRRQKFICLNDNMNHSDPHSREVVKVLKDLYDSFLPYPSSYELPPNKANRYLHLDDYVKVKEEIQVRKTIIYILLGILALCFLSFIKSCISADRVKWS